MPTTFGLSELREPSPLAPLDEGAGAPAAPLPALASFCVPPVPPEAASLPAVCSASESLEQAMEPLSRPARHRHDQAVGEIDMVQTIIASPPCGKADRLTLLRGAEGFRDILRVHAENDSGSTPWTLPFALTRRPCGCSS
jgi:hypothetical protein